MPREEEKTELSHIGTRIQNRNNILRMDFLFFFFFWFVKRYKRTFYSRKRQFVWSFMLDACKLYFQRKISLHRNCNMIVNEEKRNETQKNTQNNTQKTRQFINSALTSEDHILFYYACEWRNGRKWTKMLKHKKERKEKTFHWDTHKFILFCRMSGTELNGHYFHCLQNSECNLYKLLNLTNLASTSLA